MIKYGEVIHASSKVPECEACHIPCYIKEINFKCFCQADWFLYCLVLLAEKQ